MTAGGRKAWKKGHELKQSDENGNKETKKKLKTCKRKEYKVVFCKE